MNKKTLIIGITVLVVLVIGLVAGLFLVRQQQELRKKAAPATTVSILPPTGTVRVGEEITLSVEMDTGDNTATATDLQITFDSQKLTLKSFTPDTFLPVVVIQAQINNTSGSGTVTLGTQPANPPQGRGTLATLKFQGKAPGSASVSFGSGTRATGMKEGTDIIVSKNSSSITVLAAPGTSPIPSPSPSLTPTATPTLSPTPTTGAGTQTPTPTTPGSGGSGTSPTPTPTSAGKGGSATTATPTPTKKLTATTSATGSAQPVAGVSLPTVAFLFTGALVILLGIFLLAL